MKKKELEVLISAGAVEAITITREFLTSFVDPDGTPSGSWMPWEMWIQGGDSVEQLGPWVETTPKGRRRGWTRLESAYEFAREVGWKGSIQVEDRFRPVKANK